MGDPTQINTWINGLGPTDGLTPTASGIQQAVNQGTNDVNLPNLLVIITDGDPNVQNGGGGSLDYLVGAIDAIARADAARLAGWNIAVVVHSGGDTSSAAVYTTQVQQGMADTNLPGPPGDIVLVDDAASWAQTIIQSLTAPCAGTIHVKKVIDDQNDPGGTDRFTANINQAVGDVTFDTNQDADVSVALDLSYTVQETVLPAGFDTNGIQWAVVDGDDSCDTVTTWHDGDTASGDDTDNGGNLALDSNNDEVTVCFRNVPEGEEERTLRVIKTTQTGTHPGGTFSGTVSPGGTDTSFSRTLAADASTSAAEALSVSDAGQTVTETTLPANWSLVGYELHNDPNGTATCDGTPVSTSDGASIAVPANGDDYLVCIENEWTEPTTPMIHIYKVIVGPDDPDRTDDFGYTVDSETHQVASGVFDTDAPAWVDHQDLIVGETYQVTESSLPASSNGTWSVIGTIVGAGDATQQGCENAVNAPKAGGASTAFTPLPENGFTVCFYNEFTPDRMIHIRKVTIDDPDPTPASPRFTADVIEDPGGANTLLHEDEAFDTNATAWVDASDSESYQVTEGPLPPNWGGTRWAVLDGDVSCDGASWTNGTTASGGLLDDLDGDVTVCFENTYTSPNRELTICKVLEDNGDFTDNSGDFSFDYRVPHVASPVSAGSLNATEGGQTVCTSQPIEVHETETIQVSETAQRPPSWSGDETGYPKWGWSSTAGPSGNGTGSVTEVISAAGDITVTFTNRAVPAERTIRIIKVIPDGPQTTFTGSIDPGPSAPENFSIQVGPGADEQSQDVTASETEQTVTEDDPGSGWSFAGYTLWEGLQETCDLTPQPVATESDRETGMDVPAFGNWTVCILNEPVGRTIRVGKVTESVGHPGGNFDGTIVPGAPPQVDFTLSLGAGNSAGPIQAFLASTDIQSVTETVLPPNWSLVGYSLIADPNGTATCDDDPFFTTTAGGVGVPGDALDYLVCIENEWLEPDIDIEKHTNGADADNPTGPFIPVGDPVLWEYIVTNTGDQTVTNISVTDDVLGPITCPLDTLGPGESMTCEANGIAVPGQYENLGTVNGDSDDGPVSDEDPSHYFGVIEELDLEKHTNGADADVPDTLISNYVSVGQNVLWEYIVTNNSNVTVTDIVVTDLPDFGGDPIPVVSCPSTTLAPGASMTCTASGVARSGLYTNEATVTGETPVGGVTDDDTSHYFGTTDIVIPTPTPTVPATATPVPPTSTPEPAPTEPQEPESPTPASTAAATPIAPDTGSGIDSGTTAAASILLLALGLLAISGALGLFAFGRNRA